MRTNELTHHGIKGQKWGVRRYQNKNGSLTSEGAKRLRLENKINKQNTKIDNYTKKSDKLNKKNAAKVGKLTYKAAKQRNKAYGRFTSYDKAKERLYKAKKLEAKAAKLSAKSTKNDSKIAKAQAKINLYNRKISKIDKNVLNNGKDFVTKKTKNKSDDDDDGVYTKIATPGMRFIDDGRKRKNVANRDELKKVLKVNKIYKDEALDDAVYLKNTNPHLTDKDVASHINKAYATAYATHLYDEAMYYYGIGQENKGLQYEARADEAYKKIENMKTTGKIE